ncbi:MAG: hypothetical protein ICV84_20240 [Flavisolibacter sp.]|nr:hypothetical protein [Flavisolibacter sp.]
MQEYIINVTEIEELQTIRNTDALDKIFTRAKETLVGGGTVILIRRYADGRSNKFDELGSLNDLAEYKKSVYKYLS